MHGRLARPDQVPVRRRPAVLSPAASSSVGRQPPPWLSLPGQGPE